MEDPARSELLYRFDIFTLDIRTGELTDREMRRTVLREQQLQLLLALLERPGELISREELANRIWPPGTFVDFDRGLNKTVNQLREALGDSVESPRFIETFPRKGYRFVAQVSQETEKPEKTSTDQTKRQPRLRIWVIAAATAVVLAGILVGLNIAGIQTWVAQRRQPSPQISSVAVIPLANLSHDPEQEYFADGITDALITDLAKASSLRVISRTSIIRYEFTKKSIKDIGRELNVDAVIEGTVTRSGNRVRITAQLIQVSTDMHLWAETYERDLSEILAVQNEVATDIARRVSTVVRPLGQAKRVNAEAYGSYLKARYYFYQYTNRGWQQAIDHFNQAIQSDPNFAPAYSGLADAFIGRHLRVARQRRLTQSNLMTSWLALTMPWQPRMPGTTGTGSWRRRSSDAALNSTPTMRWDAIGMEAIYRFEVVTMQRSTSTNEPGNSIPSH
jgi:TolB-like protein/DNA-binding winged helix-turn-helix (wHTH) protein